MTTVFISYSRERYGEVKSLVEDLGALGHQAWFDHELTGGQAWWDQVLLKIRECEVFAYGLSPESLDSLACKREYAYASKLGKSVLPILVADGVSSELLPAALEELQYVDYAYDSDLRLAGTLISTLGIPASLILGRLSWKVRFPMGVIQGWVVPILFGAIAGSRLGGASLSSWLDVPVLAGDVELVLAAAVLTTSAVLAFMLLHASKRGVQTHSLRIEATGSGP